MKPRVLHLVTVYNGRAFVPRAIESAMRMDRSQADIDVLILDDASPEPGWSADLQEICRKLGAHYYCTPRNLGIPRNCSLGLATAVEKGYDYVTINNSDVIFPANLINQMIAACQAERCGSVTAWSNNVSIYSLPNSDPDAYLATQGAVDFVSGRLAAKHGAQVVDVPAGISFCIMMPVPVVRHVGVMDPIFGRGYCEESDWSLRSLAMGYRILLMPGVFTYHQGRGSNLAAGLVSGAHTTVPENEVIIDQRYPLFRQQCQAFEATQVMPALKGEAVDYLIDEGARRYGYVIVPAGEAKTQAEGPLQVEVDVSDGAPQMRFNFAGFEQVWPMQSLGDLHNVLRRFGTDRLIHNAFAAAMAEPAGGIGYPTAIW